MAIQIKDKMFFYDENNKRKHVEILKTSDNLLNLDYKDTLITESSNPYCTRGYLANYSIINNRLILSELQLDPKYQISIISHNSIKITQRNSNTDYLQKEPSFYIKNNYQLFEENYANINLPVSYSGTILVGYKKNHQSILTCHDNINFWINKYKYIVELTFSKGFVSNFKIINKENINNTTQNTIFKKFNLSKIK